jgi:hypothetical protein
LVTCLVSGGQVYAFFKLYTQSKKGKFAAPGHCCRLCKKKLEQYLEREKVAN